MWTYLRCFPTMSDEFHTDHLEIGRLYQRKREWHLAQPRRPLKEKVRILLELQAQGLPLLARQRPLRSWERPWPISPWGATERLGRPFESGGVEEAR